MTQRQRRALDLLRKSRREGPTTDDGLVTTEATFYDSEVKVAYIHWRTAKALKAHDLIEFGFHDPEHGTSIHLLIGDV